MSVLIIGPAEEEQIKAAIAKARALTIPWEEAKAMAIGNQKTGTLLLKDRPAAVEALRKKYAPQQLLLGTYRAAFSFEEQPAGVMAHLSVSTKPGKIPGPEVMQMIAEAFGFSEKLCEAIGTASATIFKPDRPCRVWLEEFEPGRMAINIVELAQ